MNRRIAQIAAAHPEEKDPRGKLYLDLGFMAGGDAVQRRFATNARETISEQLNPGGEIINNVDFIGVMSRVSSTKQYDSPIINDMDDFDLLLIVADDQKDVQPWIEQVWSKRPLPIAILATNETAPLIQPFINVKGDFYTVVGLSGAQAYGAMSGAAESTAPINALSLSSVAMALLIIGGGAVNFGRRARQRRKK
jgi:hypothetical protein